MKRRSLLLVAAGGIAGAEARYAVTTAWSSVWGSFAINVLGGLLIGVLMGTGPTERMRLLLGVGVLGGFTTFSTYTLDGHDLLTHRGPEAVAYLVATPVAVLLVTALGVRLGGGSTGPSPGPEVELGEVAE